MKQLFAWALLPAAVYCHQAKDDLFLFSEKGDEYLHHIEIEQESSFDERQGLSLLEIDESDESLVPWTTDGLACDEYNSLVEQNTVDLYDECEDAFAYEMRCYAEGILSNPSYEKITEERKRLFQRPKVIESTSVAKETKRPIGKEARQPQSHR